MPATFSVIISQDSLPWERIEGYTQGCVAMNLTVDLPVHFDANGTYVAQHGLSLAAAQALRKTITDIGFEADIISDSELEQKDWSFDNNTRGDNTFVVDLDEVAKYEGLRSGESPALHSDITTSISAQNIAQISSDLFAGQDGSASVSADESLRAQSSSANWLQLDDANQSLPGWSRASKSQKDDPLLSGLNSILPDLDLYQSNPDIPLIPHGQLKSDNSVTPNEPLKRSQVMRSSSKASAYGMNSDTTMEVSALPELAMEMDAIYHSKHAGKKGESQERAVAESSLPDSSEQSRTESDSQAKAARQADAIHKLSHENHALQVGYSSEMALKKPKSTLFRWMLSFVAILFFAVLVLIVLSLLFPDASWIQPVKALLTDVNDVVDVTK